MAPLLLLLQPAPQEHLTQDGVAAVRSADTVIAGCVRALDTVLHMCPVTPALMHCLTASKVGEVMWLLGCHIQTHAVYSPLRAPVMRYLGLFVRFESPESVALLLLRMIFSPAAPASVSACPCVFRNTADGIEVVAGSARRDSDPAGAGVPGATAPGEPTQGPPSSGDATG